MKSQIQWSALKAAFKKLYELKPEYQLSFDFAKLQFYNYLEKRKKYLIVFEKIKLDKSIFKLDENLRSNVSPFPYMI